MRSPLAAIGDEAVRLVSGTASVWLRLLPRLLALCLLGWVAYHGSVFLGTELAHLWAWSLVPVLALGVVVRVATTIWALRSVALELDAPGLLRRAAPAELVDDDRDASLVRLLTVTLLPFLGVYAAFGYVNVFAQDVVILSTYRFGLVGNDLLSSLNPLSSPVTAAVTVALVVVLYLGRRLLERWHERSGRAAPALLAVWVEASGLFVVLLSGFRLWEQAMLWLRERRLAQWAQIVVDAASGWLRIDLPEVVEQVWAFVAATVFPVAWELLTQPIAWLALAALVFGSRVRSLGELWRTDAAQPAASGSRLERVRAALAGAHGTRRVVLGLQEAFLGDIDDKYLPTWAALRLVLRAGVPFLGAFVLLFGVLRVAGEQVNHALVVVIGGQPAATWVRLGPFLDLLPNVVVLSLQLALLGTAYVHILARGVEEPATPPAPRHRWRRVTESGVVAAIVLALAMATIAGTDERRAVRTTVVGRPAGLLGGQVQVEDVHVGTGLTQLSGQPETTRLAFVVVRATVIRPGAEPVSASAELVHGERHYRPGSWSLTSLTAEPGFRRTGELVFEVEPADLDGTLEVRFHSAGVLSFYDEEIRVPAELGADAAARAAGVVVDLHPGTTKAVA